MFYNDIYDVREFHPIPVQSNPRFASFASAVEVDHEIIHTTNFVTIEVVSRKIRKNKETYKGGDSILCMLVIAQQSESLSFNPFNDDDADDDDD